MKFFSSRKPRLFEVRRFRDGKNISGIGKVIEGVEFSDGQVVIRWRTSSSSIGIYKSMRDFKYLHAKERFAENEFTWVEGHKPPAVINELCQEIIDNVMQREDITNKAKGSIIQSIKAAQNSYKEILLQEGFLNGSAD